MDPTKDINTVNPIEEDADAKALRELDDYEKQVAEYDLGNTVEGSILLKLRAQALSPEVVAIKETGKFGRHEFTYGKEKALMQVHIGEDGLSKYHTPILDLRKSWWKKVFLEDTMQGAIGKVGLIAPSVYELMLINYSEEIARKFNISNILKELGVAVENGESEYSQNEIMGSLTDDKTAKIIEAIKDYWNGLVEADFKITFDNGNGDLFRKMRIIPVNAKGMDSLLNHPELDKQHLQKIVDNYDGLMERLRSL